MIPAIMELVARRTWFSDLTTISTVTLDGVPQCFFLEDTEREGQAKIFGKTAIPRGRYRVIVNRSERFSKLAGHDVFLPLLLDVPGFEGVRIHPGNGPDDTLGCLLTGTERGIDQVLHSRVAFDALFPKLQKQHAAGGEIWLTIGL